MSDFAEKKLPVLPSSMEFEWRGIRTPAVVRISGESVSVVRECTIWPPEIERRITMDNRNCQSGDFLSPNRERFGSALNAALDGAAAFESARKPRGPGMG